jgi:subtilisin family serine protease
MRMKNKLIVLITSILLIATSILAVGRLTSTIPNDEYFNQQWSLHNTGQTGGTPDADIDASEAWDIEMGNSDVIIAFVDSGIDYTHPDLADKIWSNLDENPNLIK